MNGRFERMLGMSGLLRMALVAVMALMFGLAGLVGSAEAAVAVRAVGAVVSGTGGVTPGMPAGVLQDDILLLFIETANQASTVSGGTETWAQVTTPVSQTSGTGGTRLTVYWARASQDAPTSPTTDDSGDHQATRMIAFSGVDRSGNPWDVVGTNTEATIDTSASVAGVTTTLPNTMVVVAIAGDLPDTATTTNFTGWNNGNLTGLTEQIDNSRNAGNGGALGVATGIKATAGATGNTTATMAIAAAKAMMTIALSPNVAPVITSNGGGATAAVSVAEGTTAVTTVTATDANGDTRSYSISGGLDAARFTINPSTGALSFSAPPDFGTPLDNGGNNVYDVIVQVSDGALTDTQAIAVTVTCAESIPSSISFNGTTTANGDFNGASMVSPVDLNNLQYQIASPGTLTTGPCQVSSTGEYFFDAKQYNAAGSTFNTGGTYLVSTVAATGAPTGTPTSYSIDFQNTGVYYLWINSAQAGFSWWYGLDGAMVGNGEATNATFSWRNAFFNSGPAVMQINITTTGVHTFDLWSREVGVWIDGIILTQNAAFTPTGTAEGSTGGASDTITPGSQCSVGTPETIVIPWNADPQEASGVLTNGNTYILYARGTDSECGTVVYYVGGTTEPGSGQTFTWSSCTETATVNAVNPGVLSGATAITASLGGSGGSAPQVRWSIDGGAFSAWQASGAILTPPAASTGTIVIEAQATGACGTITDATPVNTTYDTTCSETGTVTLNALPNPITAPIAVTATVGGGASNGQVRWRIDGGPWSVWQASGALFTPPSKSNGSVEFEAMADGNCGVTSPVYSPIVSRTYETRIAALEPIQVFAAQNGMTKIRATMIYCNDLNNSGRFRVEYKLAAGSTYSTVYDGVTGAIDGGAGDVDMVWNDEVIVDIDLGASPTYALYDIRVTFVDDTDGLTGVQPAEWNVQVNLVSWADNPLLHNALRFACSIAGYADQTSCETAGGTWTINRKYATGWGTPGAEYGAIDCSTCHQKNSGNIKRVTGAVSAATGSFPGSTVSFTSAIDGSSNFGDDAGGHATSTKVCEACHSVTTVHRYNTAGQPGGLVHYNQADCTKCHEHKAGFRASCTACHGNPPLAAGELTGPLPGDDTGSTSWGAHSTHAEALGFVCNTCHTGWETSGQMPNVGNLNIGFVTPGPDGGTYDGRSTGGGYTAGPLTSITTTKISNTTTCAVYCHGYGVPQWTTTAGTVTCGACHGEPGSYGDDRAGAPTGVAASKDLSGALTGFKVGKHANHLDDSQIATGDPCALCHNGFGYADATHVNGTVNISLNAAAGVGATFTPGSPGTCSSLTCHGDAPWDSAASGGCDFCHGYPPTTANNKHASGVQAVNHDSLNITPNHDQCTFCHGFKDNGTGGLLLLTPAQITAMKGTWTPTATAHQDGNITMNGGPTAADAGYNATNGGCDTAACHANDATHRVGPGNTTSTKDLIAIGPGACGTCHDSGAGGAPIVTSTSTHVKVTKVAAYDDCTNCHAGHTTATGGVDIPNNATVGINYSTAGHAGIQLGGTGTNATISALTTEAQICWACHALAANAINEWGTNTQINTGSMIYNYGTLNQTNWIAATWTSGTGKFGYKTGPIQSIHTANPQALGGPSSNTGDTVGQIRCTYCHDVHNLNRANGDTLSGAPYLRGNWLGNPYREDGAPQAGDTWTASGKFGAVPRGGTQSTQQGGYQIDQNNGNPTNGWTANSSAGLCELCHGNGDGNFTAAEIDSLNQFGTASTDWVGTNGHSAAVLGGGDSVAANIFTVTDRNTTPPTWINNDATTDAGNPAMAQQHVTLGTGNRPYSFRSGTAEPDGWNLTPRITGTYAHDGYNWGADTNTALDSNYHNFSCSKCHNPHASRLPRLMITNCLDTKQNTWDNGQTTIPNGTTNVDGGGTVSANNSNVKFSNATSAQNCHRVKDPQYTQSKGTGWNYVTPWGTSR